MSASSTATAQGDDEVWSPERVCDEAKQRLQQLESELASLPSPPSSWIGGDGGDGGAETTAEQSSGDCQFFDYTGFLHKQQFCTPDECQEMKQHMQELVDTQWDPDATLDSFGTNEQENTARGDYFLDSADCVHFFAEPSTLETDPDTGRTALKDSFRSQKLQALNKAGHAMHMEPGTPFHTYCLSDKIRNLVLGLQWKDPVVPQSMYIFKGARTGGVVHAHQDSTFLYTTPKQSCLGLWLALDDATMDNGCLWVRPKSHDEPVRRQYKRNVAHFGPHSIASRSNHVSEGGDASSNKFVMDYLVERNDNDPPLNDDVLPAEATTPGDLLAKGFVPVECQAGDLVVFCGTLEHLSLPNHSDQQRHTFQLHLVEGPKAGVTWSEYNWLQYPHDKPFLPLVKQE